MGYYDNVKENVKKNAADSSSGSSTNSSGGNFDTLKEAASETKPDEEKGDDTPIEVLEEDGLQRNPKRRESSSSPDESSEREKNNSSRGSTNDSSDNPFNKKSSETGENEVNADLSGVEDKLDTIIEQNQELIEILRSFAE